MDKTRAAIAMSRERFSRFPKALAACPAEARTYAQCVTSKESVAKNDCAKEFEAFMKCFRKQITTK